MEDGKRPQRKGDEVAEAGEERLATFRIDFSRRVDNGTKRGNSSSLQRGPHFSFIDGRAMFDLRLVPANWGFRNESGLQPECSNFLKIYLLLPDDSQQQSLKITFYFLLHGISKHTQIDVGILSLEYSSW